jgi:protein-L-isoaspartate(D-aspartate) O-methyltransferase
MAWRCSADTNKGLAENLHRNKIIRHADVHDAMQAIDRRYYVPASIADQAYQDNPLPIGSHATISAPHMHAEALEHLRDHLHPGAHVLDLGSGTGILCSYIAAFCAPNITRAAVSGSAEAVAAAAAAHEAEAATKVIGIEHVDALTRMAVRNVGADPVAARLAELGMLGLFTGDGREGARGIWKEVGPVLGGKQSFKEFAGFDCIHVGAAADQVPNELLRELKVGGVMVVPVGPEDGFQVLMEITRESAEKFKSKTLMGVRYVPFTDLQHQMRRF